MINKNLNRAFSLLLFSLLTININSQYPFQNHELTIEERIDNILSLMTQEEKIACLSTDPSVPRLGINASRHVEGLHGLTQGGPGNWGKYGGGEQVTTTFPQSIGLAMSWNPESIKKVAEIESYEARFLFQNENFKRGGLVIRAPNADLGRDPRWGRNEECFGEDAFFNAAMTVAFVKGLQGDHPKYWRTASLMKHFLANSNENSRDSSSSDFDERLWREYYAYPFWKGIITGGSRAYMAAYNAYNGIPCTVHPMLKDITVKEWGNDGIICTDGGAFKMLVDCHHFYPDPGHAARGCIKAGINQFLDRTYPDGIKDALTNQLITEVEIDSVIRGNYRVMIKLGLLDPPDLVPYSGIGVTDTTIPWKRVETHEIVKEVTRETIVLLKNDNKILPLNTQKLKSIAIIGPLANDVLLDWYSGTPPYTVTPLNGIQNKAGKEIKIQYAYSNNGDSAVNIARNADVAVVFVGNHPTCFSGAQWKECPTPSFGREAVDRQVIELEQEELIKKIYAVNPITIVVLISSFPYAVNWTQQNVPGILHMAHNSQETGSALAEVLFGDYNPAGRLVQTWPSSTKQLPDMMDYNIRNGRTYMYMNDKPLYPFGFGLSYTSFEYSGLKLNKNKISIGDTLNITFNVTNTGNYSGEEVVQLYVKYLHSSIERPLKELKGFKRIEITKGGTRQVSLQLSVSDLAYWDVVRHSFVVEPGQVNLMIGASSQDIRLEKSIKIIR